MEVDTCDEHSVCDKNTPESIHFSNVQEVAILKLTEPALGARL